MRIFKKHFGMIICIIISAVMLIVSLIGAAILANTDGNRAAAVVLQILVLAASIALLIISIRVNTSIINGCSDVAKKDDIKSFGATTLKWYKISVYVAIGVSVLSIILGIVASFASDVAGPLGTIILVVSILSACVSLAAKILITVLVGKTNASLK